jgi:hypothetical protein
MKTNYVLFSLFFLLSGSIASAQDTTRILFIGNSFTYYNNMPLMVKAFADSAGINVVTGMHAPGGVSVGDTAQGNMAHMNNPVLFALIRSRKWDFAVIQDNQGRFVRDSGVFSGASKVVQGHLNIMDSVKANNDCAKIILFGGWAWKNGMPPYGNTGVESIKRILVNYCVLNDTMKEIISPIGEAWMKVVSYLPSVNLWDTDDAHPSYEGSYLTASTIFSSIFNLPAKTINYNGTIVPATAYKLRCFSDSSVFNALFHTKYNLGGIKKLALHYSNGQLYVPGNYVTHYWYKNNLFAGNAPALALNSNGIYKALVKDSTGCLIKSCSYSMLTTSIPKLNLLSDLELYPNPVTGKILYLQTSFPASILKLELFSTAGLSQTLGSSEEENRIKIALPFIKAGCYVLRVITEKEVGQKMIVVTD